MIQSAAPLSRLFDWRSTAVGIAGALVTMIVIGLPTAVIPNGFFTRMTPVRPLDYVFLAATSLLAGVVAATYVVPLRPDASIASGDGKATAGGLLSFLAIGCPICNKLVVLALGVSGALRFFEPIQPLLGLASIGLLSYTAWYRVRQLRTGCAACAV